MDLYAVINQVSAILQQHGRVSYRGSVAKLTITVYYPQLVVFF
jgi:hypothetical protein